MIKNGDVDHLIIQKSWHICDGEDSKKSEYKEESLFFSYTHNLEVTSGLHCALQKGNLDTVLLNSKNINVDTKSRKY